MEPEKRACEWCGTLFYIRRSDARFCWPGSKCRTAAHRARRRAEVQSGQDRLSRLRNALTRLTQKKP